MTTRYTAQVTVLLKQTVNDPEGNTIAGALESLGFEGIHGVRSGRHFVIGFDAPSEDEARQQVDAMCSRLLANPVIETYSVELSTDGG
jgi:phosphoribosylformylglycinamidine synthase